jgi:hypothetical protein
MQPFELGVHPVLGAAGVGVLHPATPVPDHFTDMELVLKDARPCAD